MQKRVAEEFLELVHLQIGSEGLRSRTEAPPPSCRDPGAGPGPGSGRNPLVLQPEATSAGWTSAL